MRLKIIVPLLVFALITMSSAFAEPSLITIQTDRASYDEGEIIVLSGKVTAVVPGTPVTIQIFREGNLIDIAQLIIAEDGTFADTIIAQGPLWKKSGEYTLKASYLEGVAAETVFNFNAGSQSTENKKVYEVNVGASGSFDVEYEINGGVVKKMIVDPTILGMVVSIESNSDGNITLKLPRDFLDAKKQDGKDESFIILIDGIEVPYKEVTNSDSRTITINFLKGDSDIEIIGTFVIPEFGEMTVLVLALTIIPLMVIGKKKFQIHRI